MNKKNYFFVFWLFMIPCFIFGQTVNVVPDRLNGTYEAGESMRFIVTGGSGSANYIINYDQGNTPAIANGTIELGGTVEIPFTLDHPGTVICLVVASDGLDLVGATFSPFEIEPYVDDPADFDSFWQGQKNRLAAIPLDPQITPITTNNSNTRSYRISLASIEGRRLYGYLSVPIGGSNLPAIISHAAFGIGPNTAIPRPEIADELNTITMSIWMHDAEPDTQVLDAYQPMSWFNRDSIYFRYGVLGIIRAMDYIETMTEFRGDGIVLTGVSEGGGMSLLTAGIDDRVTAVSASIFAHAEHTGFRFGRASGFPHYLQQAPLVTPGVDIDQVFEATQYYDVVRAAKRFEGPVFAAIGYEDLTSIPMAQFGAYNQLKGQKTLIHRISGGHTNPDDFFIGKFDFFRRHLGLPGRINYLADAGAERTANGSTSLIASIERGGVVDNSLPIVWEMISGPAPATINSPTNRTTSVSFSQDGEYEFRVRATDQTDLASTGTFYTFSDVVKITVETLVENNDNDGDGVITTEDCDDSNPNISRPGDACDDFNSNTINDVIQADCGCIGTIVNPCVNDGGDADGDGICANVDCNDFDPNISRPGDSCDDGNPNTTNDVIQASCQCFGTIVDPCASNGGDADRDGVCANEDCNDSNPNISHVGDACDDFDPNTFNDIIQADCSCLGTTLPPNTTNDCNVNFQLDGNIITVSELNFTLNTVNVFDVDFNIIQSCQDLNVECNPSQEFIIPEVGRYFIQIQTFTDFQNQVCNIFEQFDVNSISNCNNITDGGNVSGDESICIGENASPLNNITPATGGIGDIEYQWISSTRFCPFDISDAIPNANQASYQPGALQETTYFRRLSRRKGCIHWDGSSNCIFKEVESCGATNNACLTNFSINGNNVSYSNLNRPIAAVRINSESGDNFFDCFTPIGTPCAEANDIRLPAGRYILTILTAEAWEQGFICNINEVFEVTANSISFDNGNSAISTENTIESTLQLKESSVLIFPNPANEVINIKTSKPINGEIALYNQLGKVVKIELAEQSKNIISIPTIDLASGLYFIKMDIENQSIIKKVIINK